MPTFYPNITKFSERILSDSSNVQTSGLLNLVWKSLPIYFINFCKFTYPIINVLTDFVKGMNLLNVDIEIEN